MYIDVNGARELFSSKQLNFNRPGFRKMVKCWGYYRPLIIGLKPNLFQTSMSAYSAYYS